MFLKDLDQTQREVFMALAQRIVLADWSLQEGEEEALDAVRDQIGDIKPLPGDIFSNDRVNCFADGVTKRGVIYELALLIHADLEVNEGESHALGDLTAEMGLDPQIVEDLDAIARRHAYARAEGQETAHYWDEAKALVDG